MKGRAAIFVAALVAIVALAVVGYLFGGREGTLIVYSKEGGFLGESVELTIAGDGKSVLKEGSTTTDFTIPESRVRRIERIAEQVDWDLVEGDKTVSGADIPVLSIEYNGREWKGSLVNPSERSLLKLVGALDIEIARARS